jgi:tellurite resistance protein
VRQVYDDYPENSRSAILRAAILVVYSDGTWHELERAGLETIYRNICVMLDDDLDEDILLEELETISTDVPEEILDLDTDEEREEYWQTCLASIVSRDIQQLTVAAACMLASSDSEINPSEAQALRRMRKAWDVDLKDALEIWNE